MFKNTDMVKSSEVSYRRKEKSELLMEFHPENIVCIFLLLLKINEKPRFFLEISLLHEQWTQNSPVPTAQCAR